MIERNIDVSNFYHSFKWLIPNPLVTVVAILSLTFTQGLMISFHVMAAVLFKTEDKELEYTRKEYELGTYSLLSFSYTWFITIFSSEFLSF